MSSLSCFWAHLLSSFQVVHLTADEFGSLTLIGDKCLYPCEWVFVLVNHTLSLKIQNLEFFGILQCRLSSLEFVSLFILLFLVLFLSHSIPFTPPPHFGLIWQATLPKKKPPSSDTHIYTRENLSLVACLLVTSFQSILHCISTFVFSPIVTLQNLH